MLRCNGTLQSLVIVDSLLVTSVHKMLYNYILCVTLPHDVMLMKFH